MFESETDIFEHGLFRRDADKSEASADDIVQPRADGRLTSLVHEVGGVVIASLASDHADVLESRLRRCLDI